MATRRGVLRGLFGGLFAMASRGAEKQAGGAPIGSVPKGKYKIPEGARAQTRQLGRTGVQVSIVGLGGYHLGLPHDEQESIRIVRRALDHGMDFLDNCWDYNEGKSEERMGKALRDGYRQKAFLMTKLDGRTAHSAREQLDQSLRRLQTDVIGMKSMAAGLILQSGAASAVDCLRYAMSVPGVSVTITGCDSEGVLEQALWLATTFKPMSDEERQTLLSRTAPYAKGGKWEKFKTTQMFDGTEQHKHWLTSARL